MGERVADIAVLGLKAKITTFASSAFKLRPYSRSSPDMVVGEMIAKIMAEGQ
jgi:hypothetical protein